MRDFDRMITQGRARGPHVGTFMERLLEGDFPWAKLRQARAVLRLCSKYGSQRVDAACRRALDFEVINVKKVERIIKLAPQSDPPPLKVDDDRGDEVVQLPLRFQRPVGSFSRHPCKAARVEAGACGREPTVTQDGTETTTPVGADADAAQSDRLRPQGKAQ